MELDMIAPEKGRNLSRQETIEAVIRALVREGYDSKVMGFNAQQFMIGSGVLEDSYFVNLFKFGLTSLRLAAEVMRLRELSGEKAEPLIRRVYECIMSVMTEAGAPEVGERTIMLVKYYASQWHKVPSELDDNEEMWGKYQHMLYEFFIAPLGELSDQLPFSPALCVVLKQDVIVGKAITTIVMTNAENCFCYRPEFGD